MNTAGNIFGLVGTLLFCYVAFRGASILWHVSRLRKYLPRTADDNKPRNNWLSQEIKEEIGKLLDMQVTWNHRENTALAAGLAFTALSYGLPLYAQIFR